MATVARDIKSVELTDQELWLDGPPHEVFKEMRASARSTGPSASRSSPTRPASGR